MRRILIHLIHKLVYLSVLLIFITSITGCQSIKESAATNKTPEFAIYFVKADSKNGALSYGRNENGEYAKTSSSINELALEDNPVVTEKDIKKYYWDTHKIEFNDEYLKRHEHGEANTGLLPIPGSKLLGAKEFDAVVIVVNGERIYSAGFPLSPIRLNFHLKS